MSDINSNNIIPFSSFKTIYDENAANKCFKEYLEVLTFSELINESNMIINDLRRGVIDKDLTIKSRLVLKEFEKRTGANKKLSCHSNHNENTILNFEEYL
ncbi:MAG: hypothetical protein A2381_18930 [Bdellovibrionales bacterium RIFOXYB1_FULL_37_110]|nr:MAG: hypothetical protein A2181_05240 [Bdellovibrionales bacterium RIFOXYA1_FULL_38_20]OFZ46580.1 MAG: hypothetical protein A2417_13935 [Bdellovibrionales bacterium RIFOXYC1_FULL_37_79]OFZ57702.1 MAG: hypothetical protein A2381_18930 [Bdellovibrionales bacterium RIFOXYB1_FULL_37_110]OFZ62958.1 MAG: hypothetical protein A2577_11585 [Bdellovibrionales bacterium RIFOXYD1_FULL_36_51]